ncbi:hypothetical protein L6R53_27790, partial [Myxococcota bacterium]|nr:hypothetical protein [Myxococcota bacterium]
SLDGTARSWQGERQVDLLDAGVEVTALQEVEGGSRVAFGTADGRVLVAPLTEELLLAEGCRVLARFAVDDQAPCGAQR